MTEESRTNTEYDVAPRNTTDDHSPHVVPAYTASKRALKRKQHFGDGPKRKSGCDLDFRRKGNFDDDRCDAPIYQTPREQTTAELKQRLTVDTTWQWPAPNGKGSTTCSSSSANAKRSKVGSFFAYAVRVTSPTMYELWTLDYFGQDGAPVNTTEARKQTMHACDCKAPGCANVNEYDIAYKCPRCRGRMCGDCWMSRNKT